MLPFGDRLAVELDVAGHVSGDRLADGLEAEHLFDGGGNQCGILHQLAPLVGVVGENLASPADQAPSGVGSGGGEPRPVKASTFPAGQPPDRAGLVLELGEQQLGHQVVRWVLLAPVDVVREELAVEMVVVVLQRLSRLGAETLGGPLTDGRHVLFRDAEQHSDHEHGQVLAQVPYEIEAFRTHQRVENAAAELARLGARDRSSRRGVKTRASSLRRWVCTGGSLEDQPTPVRWRLPTSPAPGHFPARR